MATNTYVALDKITLGSNAASATFSSIPSTYTDLIVVISGKVSSNVTLACQINGDTGTNYSVTELYGDASSIGSARVSNNAQIGFASIVAQIASSNEWLSTLHFQGYSNTSILKTVLCRTSAPATIVNAAVGLWRSTAAINSIKILGYAGASGFTAGTTFSLYGIKAWAPEETPKATGGYVTSDSTYWYHTFPFSSTFTPNQSLTCDYLVVAGGGGTGGGTGGGGGAGGLRSTVTTTGGGGTLESALSVTAQSYTITVGAGGAGATGNGGNGIAGSNSVFSTITSAGGGLGSHVGSSGNGGSGGGGGYSGGAAGAGTAGQGYAGGNGGGADPDYVCGGGGGAGAAGSAASGSSGGAGGNGVWTALSNAVAIGQLSGGNYYLAGGGAGGTNSGTKSGGLGGGGSTTRATDGVSGMPRTGSGGGGASPGWTSANTKGGNGGSGIVIIRYAK